MLNRLHDKITCLEEHTDHIEQHLSNATKAQNAMVDIQDDQAAFIHMLHLKVADLENRLRRNNIKVRGFLNLSPPLKLYLTYTSYSAN